MINPHFGMPGFAAGCQRRVSPLRLILELLMGLLSGFGAGHGGGGCGCCCMPAGHPGFGGYGPAHGSAQAFAGPASQFLGGPTPSPTPQLPFNPGSGRLQGLPGPLQRYSGAFEAAGQKYGVDPRFLASISMLETGNGTSSAFRNKNNAMGVSNSRGPIAFGSVEASIDRMARVLAKPDGPYAGRRTIAQIAGVYCPVGAGNDVNGTNHHWPSMVSKNFARLGGNPQAAVIL